MAKKNRFGDSEYKNFEKSRNKVVKNLPKSKNRNLLKFNSKNLYKSKNISGASIISKFSFLIFDTRVVFTKLR